MIVPCIALPKNAIVALYSVGIYKYAGIDPATQHKLIATANQIAFLAVFGIGWVLEDPVWRGMIIAASPSKDMQFD
jgi:hypothetical protein